MTSYDEVIPPGKAGSVVATIHTTNMRGAIGKAVTLTTNDPKHPSTVLRIQARVVGSVMLIPRQTLMLSNVRPKRPKAFLLIRRDPTEKGTLAVTGVKSSVSWLDAVARPAEEGTVAAPGLPHAAKGDWVLEVRLRPGAPYGSQRAQVSFRTGLPRQPNAKVAVVARIRPPVRLSRNELVLPEPKGGRTGAEGVLLASLRTGLEGELTVQAKPRAFRARLVPSGERSYRILVSWNDHGRKSAPREGELLLRVGEERMTVPIRVGAAVGGTPPRGSPAGKGT